MPASKSLLTVKTDTKEEESEILTELLTRLQYSPASVTPDECPDFEIVLSGNLIGVEITKYYADYTKNGSKTQQKISEWKKFAEGLKTKLSAINPEFDYLYSSIHFHNNERNYKKIQTDKHFVTIQYPTERLKIKHIEHFVLP